MENENVFNNIDLDKVQNIITRLDDSEDYQEVINDELEYNIDGIELEEYYDELGELQFVPEISDDSIKSFISEKINEPLTPEEANLLFSTIKNNIAHKINVKKRAKRKAINNCEESEYIDYYGSKNSAYEHIYEKIMADEFFSKPLSTSFEEILEYFKESTIKR